METSAQKLKRILIKAERANKHIQELKSEVQACYSQEYPISGYQDLDSKKVVYYVASNPNIPAIIAVIAGDILHNLRTTLEHLAWQLVLSNGGIPRPGNTGFPIADSTNFYESKFSAQVSGMHEDVINTIRAMELHEGGKGHALWQLHRLDKIDKHRLLVPVVTQVKGFNIGQHWEQTGIPEFITVHEWQMLDGKMDIWIPNNNPIPLKKGTALFIDSWSGKINEKINFRFEVAFNEVGVIECKSLVETVESLYHLVSQVVIDFSSAL